MHENPYSQARPLLAYIDSHVCYDRRSIEGSSSVVYEVKACPRMIGDLFPERAVYRAGQQISYSIRKLES